MRATDARHKMRHDGGWGSGLNAEKLEQEVLGKKKNDFGLRSLHGLSMLLVWRM